MASNRKEEIRVEWSTNYTQAIQQIEQVKKSVSDNATEMENLNRIQKQLEDNFKGFESTLEFVAKQTTENEYANQKLTEAIAKLEKQISDVDKKMNTLNASLQDVAKANHKVADSVDDVTKANEKANKVADKSKDQSKDLNDAHKDLSETTKDLTNSTKASTGEMVEAGGVFELLDEQTYGMASRFRDFIQVQGGLKTILTGNADAFSAMSTKAKIATVAINTTSLALKALAVASLIGVLVVAFSTIVENWETINKSIRHAINPAEKLRDIELEKLKVQREQINVIDGQTERLKRQGLSELEIARKRLLAQQERTSAILKEIKIRRDDEAKSLSFFDNMIAGSLKIYSVFLGLAGLIVGVAEGITDVMMEVFTLGTYERTISNSQKLFEEATKQWNWDDRQKKKNYNNFYSTEEGKALQKDLDESLEAEARIQNQIDDIRKKGDEKNSADAQKRADELKKQLEEHKQKVAEIRKLIAEYVNEIATISADTIQSKMQAEWNKREYESNQKREESLKKLGETYKKNSEEYKSYAVTINELHDLELQKINDEQNAYKQTTLLFYELQSRIEDGTMNAEEMKKEIDSFLDGVESSDMKEHWAKLLGIEEIENAIALVGDLKEELKGYEIDTTKSFNTNKNALDETLKNNLKVIEDERDAKLKQLGDDEKFGEERAKINEDFNKQLSATEKDHNEASKELNKIRSEQITSFASSAIDGLANIANSMGENFEAQKAFAIAGATINTYQGFTENLNAYPQPMGGIMAGITLASGLASIMQIMKTEPNSGGASLPNVASLEGAKNQPNVQFQQSSDSVLAQTINNQNNDPIKAYVVAKDVTSQQEKDNIKKNNSSL